MGKAVFTPVANAFRFYADGSESGSSPLENQDTNHTTPNLSANYQVHLRVRIDETGGSGGGANDDWEHHYRRNGGTWIPITDSSNYVRNDTGSSLTDGSATTNRATNGISDPASGSFVAGKQNETGVVDNVELTADNFTELLYALLVVVADVSNGDTLEFKITHNGLDFTHNVTPQITVTKSANKVLTADGGSWAWTGTAAGLKYGRKVGAAAGSWAWAGQDAGLKYGRKIGANAASWAWDGQDAALKHPKKLVVDATSWAWSGSAAGLQYGRKLAANAASWAWAGQDATLTYSPVAGFTLSAEAGSWAWSGTAAGLVHDKALLADAGSWAWAGQDAALVVARNLAAGAASWAWAGESAGLAYGRALAAGAASWSWSGTAAGLVKTHRLSAGAASWSWVGSTLVLELTVPPPERLERRTWLAIFEEVVRTVGGVQYEGWKSRVERLIADSYLDIATLYHHRELEETETTSLAQGARSATRPGNAHVVFGVSEVGESGAPTARLLPMHLGTWAAIAQGGAPGRPKHFTGLGRDILFDRPIDAARSYRVHYQRLPVAPSFDGISKSELAPEWDAHIIELSILRAASRMLNADLAAAAARSYREFVQHQTQPLLLIGTASAMPATIRQDRPQQGRAS